MAGILPARKWVQQPQGARLQIDIANPLTRGLKSAIIPGARSCSGVEPVIVGATAPVRRVSAQGIGAYFSATSFGGGHLSYGNAEASDAVLNAGTVLALIRPSNTITGRAICGKSDGDSSAGWVFFQNGFGIAAKIVGSGSDITATSTSCLSSDKFALVGFSWDGFYPASTSNFALYADGKNVTSSAGGGAGMHTSDGAWPLKIGGQQFGAGTSSDFNGDIALFLAFSRRLSAAEIAALSENPWQVFAPIQRNIYAALSGGPTNIFGLSSASISSTAQVSSNIGYTSAGTGSIAGTPAGIGRTGSVNAALVAMQASPNAQNLLGDAHAGVVGVSTSTAAMGIVGTLRTIQAQVLASSGAAQVRGYLSTTQANFKSTALDITYVLGMLANAVDLGVASCSFLGRAIQYSTPIGTFLVIPREFLRDYDVVHLSGNFGVLRNGGICIVL